METILFIVLICFVFCMLPQLIAAGMVAIAMVGFIIAMVMISIDDLISKRKWRP
jgi:hypothetical protein